MSPAISMLLSFFLFMLATESTAFLVATCSNHAPRLHSTWQRRSGLFGALYAASDEWKGEVVSNTPDGKINGCSLQLEGGSVTSWTITIDGTEADIGTFSNIIYQKIIRDAKQQRFQGFRPGTIPPHLEPTYRAAAMDETARETVLEAMQQNNIRPFESSRNDMLFDTISIPPPKKKSKGKKKRKKADSASEPTTETTVWQTFDTMKGAITAGWRPGQTFSFIARGVKGQQLKDQSQTKGSQPLGLKFRGT